MHFECRLVMQTGYVLSRLKLLSVQRSVVILIKTHVTSLTASSLDMLLESLPYKDQVLVIFGDSQIMR